MESSTSIFLSHACSLPLPENQFRWTMSDTRTKPFEYRWVAKAPKQSAHTNCNNARPYAAAAIKMPLIISLCYACAVCAEFSFWNGSIRSNDNIFFLPSPHMASREKNDANRLLSDVCMTAQCVGSDIKLVAHSIAMSPNGKQKKKNVLVRDVCRVCACNFSSK